MANLIELSNELEFVPKEQLIQMSQDPNATYPSYLVLSEIQRRTQMEKMYEAQQPKPETTVAEEVVNEFASSPAGLGAMAQSSDTPNAFQSGEMGNMAPPSPMQMMASGGRTGYQAGSMTGGIESTLNNPMQEQITQEEKGFLNLLKERYVNPDGTFNKGQIAKDGLSTALIASYFTPAGAIRGGLGLLGRGVMSLGKPFTAAGREAIKRSLGRQAAKINPKMVRDPKTGKFRSQAEIGSKAISSVAKPLGITAGVGILQAPNEEINPGIETAEEKAARLEAEAAAKREADIAARQKAAEEIENQRLAKAKESRQVDMLIGLGGAIGSAKNLGELSSGISDAYFGVKSAEQASELKGLQGRLIEAQIANLTPKSILDEQNSIIEYLELAQEGVITLTDEQKKQLNDKWLRLQEQLELIRSKTGTGFAASESPTGGDMGILEKTKIPA